MTVDDLVDAIGVDAARFFLVGRSHDTTLDLDLDLAVEQSNKNPVYYVQYAHARICSILRNLGERLARAAPAQPCCRPSRCSPHERALLSALARFPQRAAARPPNGGRRTGVHIYLGELAAEFHVFYKHCRVLGDDADVAAFRAGLCQAAKATLAAGLGSCSGSSAPEQM